jgi:uncharacterized caspase-like protein
VLSSEKVIVIADSCFSGGLVEPGAALARGLPGLGSALSLLPGRIDGFLDDITRPNRLVMTASTETQASLESGELKNGVFTYYFIEGLFAPAADTNANGQVSLEEAFAYLDGRVDAYTYSLTGEHQNPLIADGIPGEVELSQPVNVGACP